MTEYICKKEISGGIGLRMEYVPIQELVHCKDCKHFGRYYGDSKKGVCEKLNIIGRLEEWFCADGKRKEGEHGFLGTADG